MVSAAAHEIGRNGGEVRTNGSGRPEALIIAKDEQLVLDDQGTCLGAELVLLERQLLGVRNGFHCVASRALLRRNSHTAP